jgi:hypothetical protein
VCDGHRMIQVKVDEDEDTKDNDNEDNLQLGQLRRLGETAMKTGSYGWQGRLADSGDDGILDSSSCLFAQDATLFSKFVPTAHITKRDGLIL